MLLWNIAAGEIMKMIQKENKCGVINSLSSKILFRPNHKTLNSQGWAQS